MTLLLTGASGFVGQALCAALARQNLPFRAVVRDASRAVAGVPAWVMPDQSARADWSAALAGVSAVIHLAARAHVMRDAAADPLAEYRAVNVDTAVNLARQAVQHGIRRMVYVSSIKVNGEGTDGRGSYSETDAPQPMDPYGHSKLEAEQALRELADRSGLELCIVRPALVYGPGVKGNLQRILSGLWRGMPLPLGAIDNRRSLMGVDNLCQALMLCAVHPAAAGQLFLASDGEDLSTTQLCRFLAAGLDRPVRLLPVPAAALRLLGGLTGQGAQIQRLCGSLQVDSSRMRRMLPWQPLPVARGLAETGAAYRRMREAGR